MGKKGEHRDPPLPEWYHHPTGGVCRWCGHLIWKDAQTVNKRRLWHPNATGCLTAYFIVTNPQSARYAVYKRDQGKCADCGKVVKNDEWQADHVLRLADCPRELKYWTLENLQTRCTACHPTNTASESRKGDSSPTSNT